MWFSTHRWEFLVLGLHTPKSDRHRELVHIDKVVPPVRGKKENVARFEISNQTTSMAIERQLQ